MDRINPADWHRAHRVIHGDLDAVLDWLNEAQPFRNPEAFAPAMALVEQRIDGKGLPAFKLREYFAVLNPFLAEGHRLLSPAFTMKAAKATGRDKRDADLSPNTAIAGAECPIDGQIALEFELAPESVLIWGLYKILQLVDDPNSNVGLRRCENRECRKLFVDRSPSKRGKFCSTRCRSRSFRAAD